MEYRFSEGRSERLPALAADLVALHVDLILAIGPASIRAAKGATSTIPIAALDFESDPVGAGFAPCEAGGEHHRYLSRSGRTGREMARADQGGRSRALTRGGPSGGCGP